MTTGIRVLVLSFVSLGLAACGSNPAGPSVEGPATSPEGFKPPPPKDGYTRITAPVIANLESGADVMYCQYVTEPLDHDVDILDVGGYQSDMGHHAVAYATTAGMPLGSSGPCTGEDNLTGVFVGGIGGEAGGGVELPEGVAFRLPAGSSIMLNTHFLNTGRTPIDGETVLDVKFVPTDPERKIASLFANGFLSFQVPPRGKTEAVAECELPREMDVLMFSNHMHEFGTHIWSEVVRVDGSVEQIHEDPVWTYEMQFNGTYRTWPLDAPLHLAKGDKLRTYCHWSNDTDAMLSFPREMCFGVSYFISDGSSSPNCINGRFIE